MRRLVAINLILALCSQFSSADPGWANYQKPTPKIVIAVIDTGISSDMLSSDSICSYGNKDFTGYGLEDHHGHGTHISGIIDQYVKNFILLKDGGGAGLEAKKADYCQMVLKYYDDSDAKYEDNLNWTIKAFRWAIDHRVDVINYSGGGYNFNKKEHDLIIEALDKGIVVVAAAGNDATNIDKEHYYPASYDKRIYVVGNLVDYKTGEKHETSNYGKTVNIWEVGTRVISRLPNSTFGYMSGTSQATAVKSGKLINEMLKDGRFQRGTKVKLRYNIGENNGIKAKVKRKVIRSRQLNVNLF